MQTHPLDQGPNFLIKLRLFLKSSERPPAQAAQEKDTWYTGIPHPGLVKGKERTPKIETNGLLVKTTKETREKQSFETSKNDMKRQRRI